MKFREKEKILRQIEEKSYEEELDENDYSILNKLSYDKEVFIRDLVAVILVESSDEKGEEICEAISKEGVAGKSGCLRLIMYKRICYNLQSAKKNSKKGYEWLRKRICNIVIRRYSG